MDTVHHWYPFACTVALTCGGNPRGSCPRCHHHLGRCLLSAQQEGNNGSLQLVSNKENRADGRVSLAVRGKKWRRFKRSFFVLPGIFFYICISEGYPIGNRRHRNEWASETADTQQLPRRTNVSTKIFISLQSLTETQRFTFLLLSHYKLITLYGFCSIIHRTHMRG